MEKESMKLKIRQYGERAEDFLLLNFCSIGLPPFPMAFHIIVKGKMHEIGGCGIPCSFPVTGDNVTDVQPITFYFWASSFIAAISIPTGNPHSNKELLVIDRIFSNWNRH